MDDKLALIETLRQLTDALTRLSGRRLRLRAERRMRLATIKTRRVLIVALCMILVTLAISCLLVPKWPLELIWPVLTGLVLVLMGLLMRLRFLIKMPADKLLRQKNVTKQLVDLNRLLGQTEVEISALLASDVWQDFDALPGEVLETEWLMKAEELIESDQTLTWSEIGQQLLVKKELQRRRRNPRVVIEWHREYGLPFPKKSANQATQQEKRMTL
ncbi:hypothetical protein H9L19_02315 [Weissella diestrammenae]|uniref:Uncharacterized protein n=1 Tax=Weissella diestrammenae TaxID=1162633 RepID=A0A7G9T6J7_9LACO|nr:hypothetical protein [Weissella diestrammenae]MCM0583222.1 hypothetical protein [Weissella diestrammenae]QNN75722.1 hypothetical protein H9L19_02315 [Weissella diestrammenae]